MKISIASLLVLLSCLPSLAQFRYLPERPKVDGIVSFTYTPSGALAQETGPIQAVFLRYGAPAALRISQPESVTTTQVGNTVVGTIKIPFRDVAGLLVLFQSQKNPKLVDHNNARFYSVPLYTKSGAVVHHAAGGQGGVLMRTSYPYILKIKPDWAWVIEQYEREIQRYPILRPIYWADLIRAKIQLATSTPPASVATTDSLPKPDYKQVCLADIDAYLSSRQPTPTPGDLSAAAQLYTLLKEPQLARQAQDRIKSVDPNRDEAQKARAEAISIEPDLGKKRAGFDAFVRTTPRSRYRELVVSAVAEAYFKARKLPELVQFLGAEAATATNAPLLLTLAQQLTTEGRGTPQAEWLAGRAIWAFSKKPLPTTKGTSVAIERTTQVRAAQATLAAAVDQQGRFLPAMTLYREAATGILPKQTDPRTNERTWLCAQKLARADSVWPFMEQVVLAGRTTTALRSDLHDWLTIRLADGVATKKPAYQRTLALIDRAERRAALTATFVDEAAPNFTLKTLDGRKASLAALRGKIAVLHFWATSCDPCLTSFTALQKAHNGTTPDPRVQHLFVNTREANPINLVRSAASKLPNRAIVPLDPIQTVSTAYAIQDLPTLVIIDANGRIRYRNPSSTTPDEIAMVIEALKE